MSTWGTLIIPFSVPRLELRKEDLILKSNVLSKFGNEPFEPVIQRRPCPIGSRGRPEVVGQSAYVSDFTRVIVVVSAYLRHRLPDASHLAHADHRKEDQLFLLHVRFHFPSHSVEHIGQASGNVVVSEMLGFHLRSQFNQIGQLLSVPEVIPIFDIPGESCWIADRDTGHR